MPERTCVACRGRAEQSELCRFVLRSGDVHWDPARREPGRGAYLHPACLGDPRARRALPRALRAPSGRSAPLQDALAAAAAAWPTSGSA